MAEHKILVVEDTPMDMQLITDLLQIKGYHIIGAASAEEGIRLAKERAPDLILIDVGLPDMGGLEATRILKGLPETRDIPVIAMTSHAMKGDRKRALTAGCSEYVTKPIDTRKLPKLIARFMEERNATGRREPP